MPVPFKALAHELCLCECLPGPPYVGWIHPILLHLAKNSPYFAFGLRFLRDDVVGNR